MDDGQIHICVGRMSPHWGWPDNVCVCGWRSHSLRMTRYMYVWGWGVHLTEYGQIHVCVCDLTEYGQIHVCGWVGVTLTEDDQIHVCVGVGSPQWGSSDTCVWGVTSLRMVRYTCVWGGGDDLTEDGQIHLWVCGWRWPHWGWPDASHTNVKASHFITVNCCNFHLSFTSVGCQPK